MTVSVFAGNEGQEWKHIISMTCWLAGATDDDGDPIFPVELLMAADISFSDGRTPFRIGLNAFNSNGALDMEKYHFEIDGPGGERITGFDTFYTVEYGFMGFRVSRKPPFLLQ